MGAVFTAVANRTEQAAPAIELRKKIENTGPEFARALPAHMTVDHFVRNALTLLHRVPKIAECEHNSVVLGLLDAARLGLEISDQRGQAYLIPRWDSKARCMKAAFQTGYRGDIDLAARAGITVTAADIRELDFYDIERGTQPRLIHKPPLGNRGNVIGFYAVATTADGRTQFEVMSVNEVAEFRDRFASQRNKAGEIYGPWVDDFDAMARKTLIRKVLNYMPQAIEFRKAASIEADSFEQQPAALPPRQPEPLALVAPNVDASTGEIGPAVEPVSSESNNPEVVDAEVVEESDATKAQGAERPVLPATAPPPADPVQQRSRPQTSSSSSGSEYGDAVDKIDMAPAGARQGEQTPMQMIVALAAQHGVEGGDAVALMCTQIVGREVVSPTDLKPPEILKVRRVLQGLPERAAFEFAGEGVPVPVHVPDAKAAPAPPPPRQPADARSPDDWSDAEWRAACKRAGVKVTVFIQEVTRVGKAAGVQVAALEEIAGVGIGDELVAWLDAQARS